MDSQMSYLTTKQLAHFLGLSHRGTSKMVHNLNIPYIKEKNRYLFDMNSAYFPDFFLSIQLSLTAPNLKPIYSLLDIATKLDKDKKTIHQMLIENDIKMYRNGKKYVVLLVDFQRLKSRTN
jgi:hypothetical protein